MRVQLIIEGGGDPASSKLLRQAFGAFITRAVPNCRYPPSIIAGDTHDESLKFFAQQLRRKDVISILLVDSEAPVPDGVGRIEFVNNKDKLYSNQGEHRLPSEAASQVYLMVQMMEAWLLADPEALANYYGQDFHAASLPRNPNVEQVSKSDIEGGLRAAVKDTREKYYHKVKHGFDLIGEADKQRPPTDFSKRRSIDPQRVRAASRHCDEFINKLAALCQRT